MLYFLLIFHYITTRFRYIDGIIAAEFPRLLFIFI